jgi:hypothetical protein
MDGGALEASQHAQTTREEGPEERQQPQQQPKTKHQLQLKLQLKLQPRPSPRPRPDGSIKQGIKASGVWYRVEAFMNAGPDSRCQLCCGWGHLENKCGSKPKCGYCSGNHRKSDHKCNVVWCMAKHGSLCGHMLEECPNCKGNDIAFSSRCVKKSEGAKGVRQSRKTGPAGRAPASKAVHMATGTNRLVLGRRPSVGAATGLGGQEEEMADEMADVQEDEAAGEARDVVMTKTETVTTAATETETDTEAGAPATNE